MLPDYFDVLCAGLSRDRNPRIRIPAVTTLDHCIKDLGGAKFSPRFLRGGAKFSPCGILPHEKILLQFFPLPGSAPIPPYPSPVPCSPNSNASCMLCAQIPLRRFLPYSASSSIHLPLCVPSLFSLDLALHTRPSATKPPLMCLLCPTVSVLQSLHSLVLQKSISWSNHMISRRGLDSPFRLVLKVWDADWGSDDLWGCVDTVPLPVPLSLSSGPG